jgi:hypothetical protein
METVSGKNECRREFCIDLGISLMDYAFSLDWDGESNLSDYVTQQDFTPCDCEK